MSDKKLKKKYKIINVGNDNLDEYDLNNLPDDCKYLIYHYTSGCYEGNGTAIFKSHDNKFSIINLGHCSCYGPMEGFDKDKATMTKKEVLEEITPICDKDYDFAEKTALLKEFKKIERIK